MLKDRKKLKGQHFAPVENDEHNFWRKFGGIAPIPPAPVEGQRSRVKVNGRPLSDSSRTSGAVWRSGRVLVAPPGGQVMN